MTLHRPSLPGIAFAPIFYTPVIAALLFGCFSGGTLSGAEPEAAHLIRLNSIGYLPKSPKVASIAVKCQRFTVEDARTGSVKLHGMVKAFRPPGGDETAVWLADFSELKQAGEYRLVAEGIGASAPFPVAADVYNDALLTTMKGMYLLRCGCAVSGRHGQGHFQHPPCHLQDGLLDFVPHDKDNPRKDGAGGWHDAGDYNKYVTNGAFTAGMMLHTWIQFHDRLGKIDLALPDGDPRTPDMLEEIKWELDWLFKMQAADGSVYHKLSTLHYGGYIMPEDEDAKRYFCPWGSAATADFVAVMALGSRVYRSYDSAFADRCLSAAKLGYAFLQTHPQDHRPEQGEFQTGGYVSSDSDDRLWAAAEFWEATQDESCLQDLEKRLQALPNTGRRTSGRVAANWDWGNLSNLGVFTYLKSTDARRDPRLLDEIGRDLLDTSDRLVEESQRHPYARPLGDRYYWGCNGTVARQTMILMEAYRRTEKPEYRDTALNAISYLFGRNPYGRSFVTGVGFDPPRLPHDRRSAADDILQPWPGYLVGGGWPSAGDWRDEQDDYRTNEIAINWNGALIYALAGFFDPSD